MEQKISIVPNIHCTKHWYVIKNYLPQKWLFRNIITLFIENTTLQMWASQPLKRAEWHILLSVNKVNILYFPAHKKHFFSRKKCDLNSTCVLCAEDKYYFQTYKYSYPHRVKTTTKMILVAVTTIFWVCMMNKLYYGC